MWLGIMALIAGTAAIGSNLRHAGYKNKIEEGLAKHEEIRPIQFANDNDRILYGTIEIHITNAKRFMASQVRIMDCIRMMEDPTVCKRLLAMHGLKWEDYCPK